MMAHKQTLKLRFLDGRVETYEWTRTAPDGSTWEDEKQRWNHALKEGFLRLQSDEGAVLVFVHALASIEISPAPQGDTPAFKTVRRVSE